MVEASAQEVTEDVLARRPRRGPRRHQADRRPAAGPPRAGRQAEAPVREEGARSRASWRRSRAPWPSRSWRPCASRARSSRYAQMKKVKDAYVASIPEDQPEKKAAFASVYDGLREKLLKREIFENGHRLDGRALRRDPGDHLRGRRPAAHPRLGPLHPRRDPGPGDRDPRHLRGLADHRHRAGGRVPQALHAALQLPALLGRRGEVPARPRPPRDRPRRPGRAVAARDAAGRGGLPLHDPHRLRHPRVERLVLDGHRLRRHPRADGRRACRSRARWPASPWAS